MDCTGIKSLTVGANVTRIEESVFRRAKNLEWVVIGAQVKALGMEAFSSCDRLQSVFYGGTKEDFEKISILSDHLEEGYVITSRVDISNATMYFYSETEAEGCWRYVDGVPTVW